MNTFLWNVGTVSLRKGLICFSILVPMVIGLLSSPSISLAAAPTKAPIPNGTALTVKVVTTATNLTTKVSQSSVQPPFQLPASTTPAQLQDTILQNLTAQYPQLRWTVEVFNVKNNASLVSPASDGPISLISNSKKHGGAPGCHGRGHHCDPKTKVPVPGPGTGHKCPCPAVKP